MIVGAGLTLAFAPFNQWYLVFVLLPAAFYLFMHNKGSAFWASWCFGLGYFGAGISWVHVSIAEFGGIPLIASIALMLILCGYLALFPALAFKFLKKYFSIRFWPLAVPLFWLIMEWTRANFLTGFPWLSIGYSQSNSLLSAWLPVVGETGLSVLIVLVCMSIALAFRDKQYIRGIVPVMVLWVSAWALSGVAWTNERGENRSVALVQGNIPQSMRWDPVQDKITMQKYIDMTQAYWGNDIVVWPEAAVPSIELSASEQLLALDMQATHTKTGFITGVVDYNFETDVAFNSLLSLGIDIDSKNTQPYEYQHSNRFSKHHLLPIGEFVPFESLIRPLAPIFDLPMSSFSRGDYVQKNLIAGNTFLTPAICFEIVFPNQIAANLGQHSDMIITVSNDAWFGDSHGPHQHLQIAQVRAKEFGLPVLRATNNGVTAIIDHKGNITGVLEQFTDAVLTGEVELVTGITPYRKLHDWPIWVFSLMLFLLAFWMQRRSKN